MEALSKEEAAFQLARAETRRRNALLMKEPTDLTDTELNELLTDRYQPPKIPPCRVCGGELSIQAIGGGYPTTYACVGWDENGAYLPGRSMADQHYDASEYTDHRAGGDPLVMEALARLNPQRMLKRTFDSVKGKHPLLALGAPLSEVISTREYLTLEFDVGKAIDLEFDADNGSLIGMELVSTTDK